MRVTWRMMLVAFLLCTAAACGAGGDNDVVLCPGCTTPTVTPTPIKTTTPTSPTPAVSPSSAATA